MSEQITARPYHKNPRKISAQQVVQLREWLAELGDLGGIVHDLNSGEIISGNQRSFHAFDLAQCEIEITHRLEDPDAQGTVAHGFVLWQGGRYAYRQVRWTAEQCEKANIIANKAGGVWDIETLLSDFEREGLLAWGFSDDELDDLAEALANEYLAAGVMDQEPQDAEPQVNRAEELRAEWGVELGQMWRLPSRTPGQEHRLICGDCTDADVVARLEPPFDMMFTDPPYGVNYTGGHFHSGDVNIKREREKLAGDTTDLYGQFLPVVLPLIDGPCYMWFADRGGKPVYDAILRNGGEIHAMLIWHKTNATYAAMNAQYKQRHEPCMYFKRKGQTLMWCGPNDECTVWEMPRDAINDFHPTQKPIHLAERAMRNHTAQTIADFFCGSGSTIIAAENLSRQCRAVEISPAYVAVALQRYQDAFGITPELIEAASW